MRLERPNAKMDHTSLCWERTLLEYNIHEICGLIVELDYIYMPKTNTTTTALTQDP